jgi:hypothetical protein
VTSEYLKSLEQEIERLAGKWNNGEFRYHSDLLIAVFAAGRAYQAGKVREKVGEKRQLFIKAAPLNVNETIVFFAIDAALDEAAKGE